VVEALNKKPKDMHGVDINRLREWALEHNSQFYRQTVLLTSWLNADMNRLFSTPSFCCNYEGQVSLSLSHLTRGSLV
jgi:U3 small nucleolar RNA-associated protein 25